jgi:hypothetical protein
MTVSPVTSRFVNILCHLNGGPTCSEFLTLKEQARLAAVCRATTALPRPTKEVVQEWQGFHKEMSPRRWLWFSSNAPLSVRQFDSILDRAARSPLFFSAYSSRLLRKLCDLRPGAYIPPLDFASKLVRVFKTIPSHTLRSPGIESALRFLVQCLRYERPWHLWWAFKNIGPEVISPGSPGCAILEKALTRRACYEFKRDMSNRYHGAIRVFSPPPHEWFGGTTDLDAEMPEVIQRALIGAVEGTGRPCLIHLFGTNQSQIQPSYTRHFVTTLAQNPEPIFVTGDAVLPTDARYISLPLSPQGRRYFASQL